MIKNVFKRSLASLLVLMMFLVLIPANVVHVYADINGSLAVDGLGLSESGSTTNPSGNMITISVAGAIYWAKTGEVYLTNNKSETATLAFDYEVIQSGDITIGDTTVTGSSGSFSEDLSAGQKIKISVKASKNTTAQLKLTNIQLFSNSTVTTTFAPAENGSYTVDGTAITAEITKTQLASQSYKLVATPAAGYKFLGWYNVESNECLGTVAMMDLTSTVNQKVTAKFVSTEVAIFETAGAKFGDLNEAIKYAVSKKANQITLVSSGTVAAGDYIIPAGITLLIPHDSIHTIYVEAQTTGPKGMLYGGENAVKWVSPTAFKTMTMAPGANITVNGAICVGGKHSAQTLYSGSPTETVGMINMLEGSSIILNNDASLYCWGFIYGDGEITVKNGATAHENFQITDFRGGTATMGMSTAYTVFPLSQYYVQNVEVATTYEYGSHLKVWTSIFMKENTYSASVDFIGEGAMFVPAEGASVTKTYDPKTDRLSIEINGTASINSMALELGGSNVQSQNFPLPINSNISIFIHSGTTTLKQTVALLPGSELTIDAGAELVLETGTPSASKLYAGGENLFVYDADEWNYGIVDPDTGEQATGTNYVYNDIKFKPVAFTPTRTYNRQNGDLKDVVVNINGTLTAKGFVYTTVGGASIISSEGTGKFVMESGAGVDEWTAQATQANTAITYMFIPITSAQLKNADGSYTETAGAEAGTEYVYKNGKWQIPGAAHECVFDQQVATDKYLASAATCKNAATYYYSCTCEEKGTETFSHGDKNPNNHVSDELVYVSAGDGFYHHVNYACCGVSAGADEECSGGTAVCGQKAVCSKCNGEYGNVLDHNYSGEVKDNGNKTHSYKCVNGCGTYGNVTNCKDDNHDHKCDTCKAEISGHTYDQEVADEKYFVSAATCTEAATYYKSCVCGAHGTETFSYGAVDPTNHGTHGTHKDASTVVTATCTVKAYDGDNLCDGCGTKVSDGVTGEVDPTNHTGTQGYKDISGAQHTLYWTCCNAVIETVDHTYVEGKCVCEAIKQITMTWISEGTTIKTETVDFGSTPNHPADPTMDEDVQYRYEFEKWVESTDSEGNITYTAKFNNITKFYDITWVNTGEPVAPSEVEYGTIPTYPGGTPTMAGDGKHTTYTFKGWKDVVTKIEYPAGTDLPMVTGEATYEAVFNTITSEHVDTDKNHECDICNESMGVHADADKDHNCDYGCTETIGTCADADKDHACNYGCDKTYGEHVQAEGKHTCDYCSQTMSSCEDENPKDHLCDICGEKMSDCSDAENDGDHNCDICGKAEITNHVPGAEATCEAAQTCTECGTELNEKLKHSYTGEIQNNDNGTHSFKCVNGCGEYGGAVAHTYTEGECVCGDVQKFTITWNIEGVTSTEVYEYGMVPSYTGAPTKAATAEYTYTFKGWDKEIAAAKADVTYTATFTSTPVNYTIEFMKPYVDNNGDLDHKAEYVVVPYGADISKYLPALPEKLLLNNFEYCQGVRTFNGWDLDVTTMPAENLSSIWPNDGTYTGWIRGEGTPVYVINNVEAGTGWIILDGDFQPAETGKAYYLTQGFAATTGIGRVPYPTTAINGITYAPNADDMANADKYGYTDADTALFVFDENGALMQELNGLYGTNWAVNGQLPWHVGLVNVGEDYYYFVGENEMATGNVYVSRNNTELNVVIGGVYTFGADGKLCKYNGIQNVDGTLYYYENHQLMLGKGLIKIGENYYYVRSSGALVVNTEYWVADTNGEDVKVGNYQFDENGKLLDPISEKKNGVFAEEGGLYYYENGVRTYKGLMEYNGGYIYVRTNGQLAVGTYWITVTNGLKDAGRYEFDENGMILEPKNGFVQEGEETYYYVNGNKQYAAGLIEYEGKYYYVKSNGSVVRNAEYWITNVNETGIKAGKYSFNAEGALIMPENYGKNGVVDGVYYVDGQVIYGAGIVEYNGGYIYVRSNGQVATGRYWVTNTNGSVEQGYYEFDEAGMMIVG